MRLSKGIAHHPELVEGKGQGLPVKESSIPQN